MTSDLAKWARVEQQFLRDELDWFDAGAKLISPGGDDISSLKRNELEARLKQAGKALKRAFGA